MPVDIRPASGIILRDARKEATIRDERFRWFDEARFGLFIHWGLFSILGRDCWAMYNEKIPAEEYAKLADQFVPERFNADEWAGHAVAGGMRYAVLTARHHDGYCLWDSRTTDFTSAKRAAKRDIVAEYVTAARKAGLRVGLYYSLLDWRVPAYWKGPEADPVGWEEFVGNVHDQVRELCSDYGPIDVLWWDGPWPYDVPAWKAEELLKMVYRLRPSILVNERTRLLGDFDTPEQQIIPTDRHWESCQCMQHGWGYNKDGWVDSTRNLLMKPIRCAMAGGNLLLNVGPQPDGAFPPLCIERLREIGQWLAVHGDAIYGTERARYDIINWHTRKGKTLYVHFLFDVHWPSWGREFCLYFVKEPVLSAFIPATGQEIEVRWEDGKLTLIGLPKEYPGPMGTVGLRLA